MTTGWLGWQGHFVAREMPLAQGNNPSSTTKEKSDALYLRNLKQAAAFHCMALEFVLKPSADASTGANLLLLKVQVQAHIPGTNKDLGMYQVTGTHKILTQGSYIHTEPRCMYNSLAHTKGHTQRYKCLESTSMVEI